MRVGAESARGLPADHESIISVITFIRSTISQGVTQSRKIINPACQLTFDYYDCNHNLIYSIIFETKICK